MSVLQPKDREIAYSIISTGYNKKYSLSNYFPEADYSEDNYWVDIHNPKIMNLLKLPRDGELYYNNSRPASTHSYDYYGVKSLWWLIIACSDYIHAHCIPTNTLIKVPTFNIIQSSISKDVDPGLKGKIITF